MMDRSHRGRCGLLVAAGVVAVLLVLAGCQSGSGSAGVGGTSSAAASPAAAALTPPPASTGSGAPAAGSTGGPGGVNTSGFPRGAGQPGIFTDTCGYSHTLADDPILAPDDPGAAMHHDFFGNTTTTASSTTAALVGGPTTCSTSADSSAYWAPVMYQEGKALTPSSALIYWLRPARDGGAVSTVPVGLTMIAGDETATSPQPISVVAWTCSNNRARATTGQFRPTTTPHDCRTGHDIRLVVRFPQCWDGHSLDGRGQTNVVYRTAQGCPTSHPVQIPQIVFHVNYPTSSAADLTLSMTPTMAGSTDTAHIDFMNGWRQSTLDADVTACTAAQVRCGPVSGPQATPRGPKARPARTRTARRHRAGTMSPRPTRPHVTGSNRPSTAAQPPSTATMAPMTP